MTDRDVKPLKVLVPIFVFESGEWETIAWGDEDAADRELPDDDLVRMRYGEGGQVRFVEVEVEGWDPDPKRPIPIETLRPAGSPMFLCGPNGCEVVNLWNL